MKGTYRILINLKPLKNVVCAFDAVYFFYLDQSGPFRPTQNRLSVISISTSHSLGDFLFQLLSSRVAA